MTKGEAIAAELTIMNFLRVTFDSVMVFSLRADMFLAAYNRFPGEATGLQQPFRLFDEYLFLLCPSDLSLF
jgi:hypothetical protein